jgi:hypothetical protein
VTAESRTDTRESEYGPTLPELLRPRLRALGRWQRLALLLAFAALIAAALALVIRKEASVSTYTQTENGALERGLAPIPFHFDYSSKLELSRPAGAYVQVERRLKGTLFGRFTVSPLRLGRQRGLVSGYMPIVATGHERRAAREFPGFRLQFEGRGRLNEVEGYQFAFTAQLRRPGVQPRQLFGRVVMLPEPFDAEDPEKPWPPGRNPTRGLVITMLSTTLDKVPSATRVGDEGILQRPFRSFRFGA